MNRVIKFRGKRIDNGEWVYGDLYHYEKFAQICVHYDDETDDLFQVVPDTVGQFTGLVDKNGKEIFEGDIVSFYPDEFWKQYRSVVVYKEERCRFELKCGEKFMHNVLHNHLSMVDVVVIGNIFDDKQLLKGGDNE